MDKEKKIWKVALVSDDKSIIDEIKNISNDLQMLTEIIIPDSIPVSNLSITDYDLIIIDTDMKNIGAFDLVSLLKSSQNPNYSSILLLSLNENNEFLEKIIIYGVNDYILKPINRQKLLIKLKNLLLISNLSKMLIEARNEFFQKNREKDELLGLTAHDLKNPINSISMLSKVLRDTDELSNEEIKIYSSDIASTAERMLALIKELLDFRAIEEGRIRLKPEELELNEITLEVVEFYKNSAEKKDISLNVEIADNNLYVKSDRNAIVQILDNLISNAIKYTMPGKNVFVRTKEFHNQAIIEIADEGQGFTEEDKKKIFQNFSKLSAIPTAGEHSTGLGLSIVKKYADLIGADLKLESEAGRGSTFIISLPIVNIED